MAMADAGSRIVTLLGASSSPVFADARPRARLVLPLATVTGKYRIRLWRSGGMVS
jgi:hypothetical protein